MTDDTMSAGAHDDDRQRPEDQLAQQLVEQAREQGWTWWAQVGCWPG